jgi:SNF2 family DNA or RNA helicase
MPELPKIWRQYSYYELGPEVRDAYIKKVKQYREMYNKDKTINVITYLNDMRYLTGLAKIEPVVDYVEEFLENNPGKKITVFSHHHDTAKLISQKIDKVIERMNAEMNKEAKAVDPNHQDITFINETILTLNEESKFEAVEKFRDDPKNLVFIGTTLACGEGLNMQFCHHAVLVEREWNPANEEQAEKRFSRIGIEAGIDKIIVLYPTALGTIDEFFANLVEQKRAWMKAALDGEIVDFQESSLIKELAEMLAEKGLDHWKIEV